MRGLSYELGQQDGEGWVDAPGGEKFQPVFENEAGPQLTLASLKNMCRPGEYRIVVDQVFPGKRQCIQVISDVPNPKNAALAGLPLWTYYADEAGRLYRRLP